MKYILTAALLFSLNLYSQDVIDENYEREKVLIEREIQKLQGEDKSLSFQERAQKYSSEIGLESERKLNAQDLERVKKVPVNQRENTDIIEIVIEQF